VGLLLGMSDGQALGELVGDRLGRGDIDGNSVGDELGRRVTDGDTLGTLLGVTLGG